MAEFLEAIESIKAEEASIHKLFGGEGVNVRQASRRGSPEYMRSLSEAADLVAGVYAGRKPMHYLQEALTTSDFPLLFADILDRSLLAAYQTAPKVWPNYVLQKSVRDFRSVKIFPYPYGGSGVLPIVPIDNPYPEDKISDTTPFTFAVQKYGRRIPFAWETIVNDDLDALKDIPARFGRACAATEDKFVTQLYCVTGGIDPTFWTDAHKNRMTVACGATNPNPVLSIAGLQDAYKVLALQTDPDGNPIVINTVTLVVPPALAITAQNIVQAFELWLMGADALTGATANQNLHTLNWMKNKVRVVVNPWIPVISTTGTFGNTMWFLFADPSTDGAALVLGKLRGYEEPQIFMKAPNTQMIGGGQGAIMDGDFDTDAIQYKVRHILGGATLDWRLAIESTGQAS